MAGNSFELHSNGGSAKPSSCLPPHVLADSIVAPGHSSVLTHHIQCVVCLWA